MKSTKNVIVFGITIVCLILGIVIAWQYGSVKKNLQVASYEKKRVNELVADILQEKSNNEKLQKQIEDLKSEIGAFSKEESVDKEVVAQLKESILTARIMAGLETVKGKGLIITMSAAGDRYIEDRHILDLLNELRASDVQAMAVNDERIVSTSEIRKAGRFIMVNGRQLVSPYIIKAIGNPTSMENSLRLMGGILEKFELYEFKVEISHDDSVIIPAVRDDGTVLRSDFLEPLSKTK
jgi:uncharacterized protein YlxW (UPF0749 family)